MENYVKLIINVQRVIIVKITILSFKVKFHFFDIKKLPVYQYWVKSICKKRFTTTYMFSQKKY